MLGADLRDFSWLVGGGRSGPMSPVRWLRRLFGESAALAIATAWDWRRYDAIYASGEDVGLPLALALRVSHGRRPHLVMRMEQVGYGRTSLRRRIYEAFARLSFARVDRVLCRTEAHVELLTSRFGRSEQDTSFVPESVDTSFFDPSSSPDEAAASKVPACPYILAAGLEMRDYQTLLAACDGLPTRVVIAAGSPWSRSGAGLDAARHRRTVSVGSFTRAEMRELYRHAALVVVPVHPTSRACGMNVVLEAWAMSCPVIASDTAGLRSYIRHKEDALTLEPHDSEALRETLSRCLRDQCSHKERTEAGRRKVLVELSLDRYLQTVTEYLAGARETRGD
jgi:glycosyltransferase involved in cell wall biosynthesis